MDNSPITIDELAANLGTTSPRLQALAARLPLATDFRISSVHIGRHHRRVLVPLILFGKEFWHGALNLDYLAEQGTISPGDQDIIDYAETADEAWAIIAKFYKLSEAA